MTPFVVRALSGVPPQDLLGQPSRDEGQQWARDELSDPIYREADMTLFERIGRAITDFFDDLFEAAAGIESPWLLAVVAVAVLAMVVLIVWWTRRSAGVRLEPTAPRQPVFRSELDPVALRRTSAEAAAAEDWRLAIQDLVRAVFAEQAAAKRIVIDRSSTAQELATASGAALPRSAGDFTRLASVFDEVSFSGSPVTREDWDRTRVLDSRITRGTGSADSSAPGSPTGGTAAPAGATADGGDA
ncbi:DUF4129 domain-containing protein [Brevibacterium yomogidense]|uniref:DUF4129 domain-containing protein n=1 Tax=Brevibacterium yomogidense TaxID=946573 RepID=UPI0018E030B8|nr:DUF4129 domain-containing protein [Brevibacterium yomogidense]